METAEVVIVGGGVIGVSIADHLARAGLRNVLVVERLPALGRGSTDKAEGGFRHQFASAVNIRLSLESLAVLAQLAEETGSPTLFQQNGYLLVATSKSELESLRGPLRLQQQLGVPVREVSPQEIAALAPVLRTTDLVGGTYCPVDGYGEPLAIVAAYATRAQAAGVRMWLNTEVTAIEQAQGRIRRVRTSGGDVATPVVICAAGAWSANVGAMVGLQLPIRPYPRTLWQTAALPAMAGLPFVIDVHSGFHFLPKHGGALFGYRSFAKGPRFDTTPEHELLPAALAAAAQRAPVVAEAPIAQTWAGLYEMTPDAHPILGPVPAVQGFWVAAGFSGHGVMHAPATGRILAEWLTSGAVTGLDVTPLRYERFAGGAEFDEGMIY